MTEFMRPKVTIEEVNDTVARFIMEPLERGYGYTLGNCMRRVLLSSLDGAKATAIQIDGVQHEFTTAEGIIEDITDIVLNLLIRYTIKYPSICKLWFQIIKIWVKSLFRYKKEECKYPVVKQFDKESFISILINVKENEEVLSTILDQLMNIQNPRFKFISYSGHMTKLSELIVQQFSEIDKRFFLIKSDRNSIINHIPDSLYIDYSANTKI